MIGPTGENLVFLLGLPRSGTTMLCAMLDNHPAIHCPPEPWILLALEAMGKVSPRHPAESHALGEAVREFLSGGTGTESARAYAVAAYNHRLARTGKSILVDKTPRYFLSLDYIYELLPQAKYVWLARNPMAVAASYKSSWGISIAGALARGADSIVAIDLLVGLQRLTNFGAAHGLLPVRYEDVVCSPEESLAKVLTSIGVSYAKGLTEFDMTKSGLAKAYAGDKKITETHRPHTHSLQSWRNELSLQEKQLLLESLGASIFEHLGYHDVLEQLREDGVEIPREDRSREWLQRVELALADRVADVNAISLGYAVLQDPSESARQLERSRSELALAQRTAQEHSERLAELKSQFEEASAEVKKRRLAAAKDSASFDAVQTELKTHQTKAQAVVKLLLEVEQEMADTLSSFRALHQEDLAEHDRKITLLTDEIAQLRMACERHQHDTHAMAQLLEETRHQTADQLSQIRENARLDLQQLQSAHADETAAVAAQLAATQDQLDAAGLQLSELQSALASTQTQLYQSQQQTAAVKSKLDELQNQRLPTVIANFFRRLVLLAMLGPYTHKPKVRPLPKITLVTPCYNSADTIRQTIESVLSQQYPNLEYIVVDGGSTDATASIVIEYAGRITRFISERDNGMYDAVAKGLDQSTGEVLGYINADDLLEPGGLVRVGEYFRDHPLAKVIQHEDTVDFGGWRFPNNAQPKVDHIAILKGHILFQDGVFYRREAYFGVGGFNRLMRRAGDWEMWARLSRPFSIRNRPGHVSCFRIRAGQLSQDLNAYYAEIEAQRPRLRAALGLPGLVYQNLRHYTNRAINLAARYMTRRPLFFPLKTSGAGLGFDAPDGRAPQSAVTGDGTSSPRCPLSRRHPDAFLFSSKDTRFGDDLINHVYHCSETDVAVVHPPLSREELNRLYEKYYSNPHTQIIPTQKGRYSPYQKYSGGSWLMKLVYRIKLPIYITRTIHWTDRTYEQLLEAVSDTFSAQSARDGHKLRFLDVGCFEGSLLDRVSKETDWQTFGLEPNAHAVAKCLAKGHKVWEGYADDASFVVPAGETFDLIYLGQTIEHLADPLTVTRRLRDLLRPGGLLVMSTPNLRAMQIELFGPTWAHWHVPYHRNLFSESALRKMAEIAGLEVIASRHYCHPYWTCLSVAQNDLGIGAVVSHAVDFSTVDPSVVLRALSLTYWNNLLYNWRGKGDFMFMVMKKPM